MKKFFLIFVALLSAVSALGFLVSCENSVTPPTMGKMHIFVYGNDYQYGSKFYLEDGTFVGNGKALKGTVNDALQVGLSLCALAQKAGYDYDGTFMLGVEHKTVSAPNVTVIDSVYLGTFREELDSLAAGVSDQDITILYFSGHGLGSDDKLEYGEDASEETWFGFRQVRETTGLPDLTTSVLYPLSHLLSRIENLPGTKVLLGDFCYSGGFVRPGNVSVTPGEYSGIDAATLYNDYRKDIRESSSLFCLSAARYSEQSWEPGDGGHGYFTAALLKALGWDEEKQAIVAPAAMVGNYLSLFNISNYVTANDSKSAQTPMSSGGSNDIILFSF